jgi:hypothetical protein
MPASSDRPGDRRNQPREPSGGTSKKPYRSPRLVAYGSLSRLALTATKGGTKADGAANSRA